MIHQTPRIARWLALVGVAFLLAVPRLAGAQDATPGPGSVTFPVTPGASNCTVATPRTVDGIQQIVAAGRSVSTPEATLISSGTPMPNQPGGSAAADPQTVDAITATLITYYGCVNSGNLLAASAMETDGFVAQQIQYGLSLSMQPLPAGTSVLDTLTGTPTPLAQGQQVTIVGVRDVIILRTGDVRAVVEVSIPGKNTTASDTISFVRQADGSFLIGGAIVDPAHGNRPPR